MSSKYDPQVLSFVDNFWKKNYRPPSMREIQRGLGIPSSSHIMIILNQLYGPGTSRNGPIPDWVKECLNTCRTCT